jgi:hypothetical protein
MSDRLQTQASNGAGVDVDALETSEWLEALDAVVAHDGPERARDLLTRVVERAQHVGTGPIASLNTPYVNTIPIDREADLRRTHQCPPDRWTPLTQMPLTRAPRRTRSTRVGSVSSSSRSCRGRRAFRSWSVFTPLAIWGDSSAANRVRGESAPLGSARILLSAWSWHRPEELLAVGER